MILYILDCDHGVKVGVTSLTIEKRLADLRRGSGILSLDVVRTWEIAPNRLRSVEGAVHWLLRDTWTVGEWFHCHPFEAVDAVESILRKGFPVAYFGDLSWRRRRSTLACR